MLREKLHEASRPRAVDFEVSGGQTALKVLFRAVCIFFSNFLVPLDWFANLSQISLAVILSSLL